MKEANGEATINRISITKSFTESYQELYEDDDNREITERTEELER